MIHKAKICDGKEGKTDVDYCDFIKGGIQKSETMIEAIKREILEETGLDVVADIEELPHKIYFEFPSNLKRIVGYDVQETTMFIVRLGDQLNNLKCEDDEIDEYVFVDKDEVNDKLSHEETKEFWRIVSKKLRP
ncbi:NUDIX hydrolase [Lachnoclostridium sp.]|uniref:NUDIX hydrolase n=1 Tax=Lachnoclostridium sp. TaxID=2028282 RepID=UPI0028A2AA2B|nr:NUDIX hydrolase [Lachnoclostridium sp.]